MDQVLQLPFFMHSCMASLICYVLQPFAKLMDQDWQHCHYENRELEFKVIKDCSWYRSWGFSNRIQSI